MILGLGNDLIDIRRIEKTIAAHGERFLSRVYTDIERDSTLTGPNFEELEALARAVPVPVIASGGVTTAEQIACLAQMGLEGAIVGSALYAGKITLPEALAAAKRNPDAD